MKKSNLSTSPVTALYKHIDKLKLPEFVMTEIWEKEKFFSESQISAMTNWQYDHFINWYENNNNL
jgi:hypothetical protein